MYLSQEDNYPIESDSKKNQQEKIKEERKEYQGYFKGNSSSQGDGVSYETSTDYKPKKTPHGE